MRDEEQDPVIIYEHSMLYFARAIDRATRAVLNTVPEVEPADERREKREAAKERRDQPTSPNRKAGRKRTLSSKSAKAATRTKPTADEDEKPVSTTTRKMTSTKKKRPNQGRRWTEDHDSLLIIHYKNGVSIEELAELLGRGEFSIEVRLAKLGLSRSES